jgi:hypothetical protein
VVNADPSALSRISDLLRDLDKPLRNLLISVRQTGAGQMQQHGGAVSGSLQQGNTRITTGRPAASGGSGVIVSGTRRTTTSDRSNAQSIRALEGTPVLISNGQLQPLLGGGRWGPGIEYQDIQQGFTVSARVDGERVTLDIDARGDHLQGSVVHTANLRSAVSGTLGEWIYLGGSERSSASAGSNIGSSLQTGRLGRSEVEVRVELLD